MMLRKPTIALMLGSMVVGVLPLGGCENMPGTPKQQGAVIGGLGGAAAGAAISKDNRLLGGLIGGAVGAGGGYLVGANWDKIKGEKKDDAKAAVERAQSEPAKASDVSNSKTADLNKDGFVTLDEVVAMKDAGLGDKEMIQRLERTGQYFELTSDQEKYLREHGVDQKVITAMAGMNPEGTARTAGSSEGSEVIGSKTGKNNSN